MRFDELYSILLTEMLVVGDSSSIENGYVIAFDKWIWILNDVDEAMSDKVDDIISKLPLTIDFEYSDAYDFISQLAEYYNDVLVGSISNKILHVYRLGTFQLDPKSSVLVKKVVSQLKLKGATYDNDFDGNLDKVLKNNMKMVIPDVVYHGTTSKYLENILSIGLRPNEVVSNYVKRGIEHPGLIFFTTLMMEAMHHASHSAKENGGYPIILEMVVPDKNLIIADYDVEFQTGVTKYYSYGEAGKGEKIHTYGNDPLKLSKEFGLYGYRGNIKPKFIKSVYVTTDVDVSTMAAFKKMKPSSALKFIDYN